MSASLSARDTEVQAAARPRGRMRRAGLAVALAVGLGGAAWFGAEWWRTGRFLETTDDAYVGGDVTTLAARVAGPIAEVLVTDNQAVRAGQALIRIDPRPWQAALDRAAATLVARRAALAGLRAEAEAQRAAIAEQEATRVARVAERRFAGIEEGRYRTLAGTPAGSRENADRTAAESAAAAARLNGAEAALTAGRQKLVSLIAGIDQATALLADAEAARRRAALDLDWTTIRAPFDGRVGNRAAEPGA